MNLVGWDGVRLVCRDWGGAGAPVVLLHGLAGQSGEWEAVARRLSPAYRLIALDQRGHGGSERRPEDVSRAAYAGDVIAVLDQLGLQRAALVGQSLGGHTAMLAAAAHPGRVSGVVLVEAGAGGPSPETPAKVGSWLGSWPVPFPSREAAVKFLGGGPVGEGGGGGLEERADGWWPRFEREVMVRSLAPLARRDFWEEWRRVSCPALLVLAQSGFIPAEEAERMLRERPATVAASVPGTGHDLHLERPDALCGLLADFLERLDT